MMAVLVVLLCLSLSVGLFFLWRQARRQRQQLENHYQQQLAAVSRRGDALEQQLAEVTGTNQQLQHKADELGQSLQGLFEQTGGVGMELSGQIVTMAEHVDGVAVVGADTRGANQAAVNAVAEGAKRVEILDDNLQQLTETQIALQALKSLILDVSQNAAQIRKIADESRLLSLNASIEAARAGEFGRGFAVVAQSVTELAEKSAETANEISQISARGNERVDAALSSSTMHIESAQQAILDFREFYQAIDDSVQEVSHAGGKLQQLITDIQSECTAMNNHAKARTEGMVNFLANVIGTWHGVQVVDISVQEAHRALDQYDVLVDVRKPSEFNDELGHIRNAINMNVQDPDFQQQLRQLDPAKSYLWICRSGGRSARAAQLAMGSGFTGTNHNMEGGMLAWNKAALTTA